MVWRSSVSTLFCSTLQDGKENIAAKAGCVIDPVNMKLTNCDITLLYKKPLFKAIVKYLIQHIFFPLVFVQGDRLYADKL